MKKEKRYDRLPKWVQQEITTLKSNIVFWKDKAISHSKKDSNISYRIGLEDEIFLPKDSDIQFHLPSKYHKNSIEVSHYYPERKTLRISSYTGGILVRPVADNVVEIRLREEK